MPTNKVVQVNFQPNASGIRPTEFKVVILPVDLGTTFKGTSIIMADQTKERDKFAQMEGTLVAVSPLAFTYADWPEGAQRPKVGDRVLFAKYAGAMVPGKDGVDYKIVADKDIAAVLD